MPVDVQGVALRYVAEARTALAFGPEAESPD
jgi:hypothetical protein